MESFADVSLRSGNYHAVLTSGGAGLASFTLCGIDLVMPHDPHTLPKGYSGQTLLPWPNRLRDGQYMWDGQLREFPCNDEATHTALHGLVAESDWDILDVQDDSARFGISVTASAAFPWSFESQVHYVLDSTRGLSVTITTRNLSDTPMPYGVSHHPYLRPGGGLVDEWVVQMPAQSVYEADEQMIPVRKHHVESFEQDYRSSRAMAGVSVDHCFTDLPHGEWSTRITSEKTGVTVELHSDARWLQMYSADAIGRGGVAVEPMTCPPNALATGEDLIIIPPGQEHTFSFRIAGWRN